MARSNSPDGLQKLGFTLPFVKEWRERENEAGRPCGIDDFFRAHEVCAECGGHGMLVTGVRWRDAGGMERSEEGPAALLIQHHGLEDPENRISDLRKWDYFYETCGCCGGSGRSTPLSEVSRGVPSSPGESEKS